MSLKGLVECADESTYTFQIFFPIIDFSTTAFLSLYSKTQSIAVTDKMLHQHIKRIPVSSWGWLSVH